MMSKAKAPLLTRIAVAALLSAGASISVKADAFYDYYDAYNKGDYAGAAVKIEPLAKKGVAEAQYLLATMFEWGKAYRQDWKAAVEWYSKAADQGHPMAQMHVGLAYELGQGTDQNYFKAQKWYWRAALQGSEFAQYELGKLRYFGKGSPRDILGAYVMESVAAANGWVDAEELRDRAAAELSPEQIAIGKATAEKCLSSKYEYCE
jgi:TPR repeat protein